MDQLSQKRVRRLKKHNLCQASVYATLPVCRSVRVALYKYVCMYSCIWVNVHAYMCICIYVDMDIGIWYVHAYASRYAYISIIYNLIIVYIYIFMAPLTVWCAFVQNSNSFCAHICSTLPSKRTMCQHARVNLNSIHASHDISCIYGILLHCQGKKHGLNGLAAIQPRSSCQILSSKPSRFNLSKSGIGRGALKPPGEKMAASVVQYWKIKME